MGVELELYTNIRNGMRVSRALDTVLRAIAESDFQPAWLCRRRHFGQRCARLPARCSSSASPKVRNYHTGLRMQASVNPPRSMQTPGYLPLTCSHGLQGVQHAAQRR